jgi:hypothetical protein
LPFHESGWDGSAGRAGSLSGEERKFAFREAESRGGAGCDGEGGETGGRGGDACSGGEVVLAIDAGASVDIRQCTHAGEMFDDSFRGLHRLGKVVEHDHISGETRIKCDRGTCVEAVKIHAERTGDGEAEGVIAVAPVFDEGDIRI